MPLHKLLSHHLLDRTAFDNIFAHTHVPDEHLRGLTQFASLSWLYDLDEKSAFEEYPFGQNNLGLVYEFYLNSKGDAEYMYERSSKSNFPLSEYNLANLLEKEGNLKESINYYKRASDHENDVLVYRGKRIEDKRLEISKKFIICLTNLKLVDYYLAKSNYIKTN